MSRGRGRGGMSRGRGRGASQSSNRATSDDSQQGEGYKREPLAPLVPTIVVFEKRTPAELQGLKLKLLNTVSASLIKEPKFDSANSIATTITLLVKEIAFYEPEFILKLALYTRDDLVCPIFHFPQLLTTPLCTLPLLFSPHSLPIY
jgi:hypothetical protein